MVAARVAVTATMAAKIMQWVVATTDSGGGDEVGIVALSVSAARGLLCRG